MTTVSKKGIPYKTLCDCGNDHYIPTTCMGDQTLKCGECGRMYWTLVELTEEEKTQARTGYAFAY